MLVRVVLGTNKPELKRRFRNILAQPDVTVETMRGPHFAWTRLTRKVADVFVVDDSAIPSPLDDSIALLRQQPDMPEVVVLSDTEAPEEQAGFLAAGCTAVLHMGLSDDRLRDALTPILEKRAGTMQRGIVTRRVVSEPRLADFVHESPIMQAFMNLVRRVVSSDVSLLLQGETGVGKERLARAIHAESRRSAGPFIAINCGALPETLLESELFGHVEGAFTGATRSRRGWFELSHAGTVFLDEIGELPYHLQVKLLRALQEHEIQPVGGERTIEVDVRVMAATNTDLGTEVDAKRFRSDLYHRLNVVTLTIPPLRERREDIPGLVDSYIGYFQNRIGCSVDEIDEEALEALCNYAWPGNVRELMNVIERGMLLCEGSKITLADLPESIALQAAGTGDMGLRAISPDTDDRAIPEQWLNKPLREVREACGESLERRYLAGLLKATGGRIGETARRAGIRDRSLYDKMKRHGLRKEDFRARHGGER